MSSTISFTTSYSLLPGDSTGIVTISDGSLIPSSIDELSTSDSFDIYPNPANEMLTIEFASFIKSNNTIISFYSIEGKLLKSQIVKDAKTEINISNFAKGMYFLQVEDESGVVVKKFVKE